MAACHYCGHDPDEQHDQAEPEFVHPDTMIGKVGR